MQVPRRGITPSSGSQRRSSRRPTEAPGATPGVDRIARRGNPVVGHEPRTPSEHGVLWWWWWWVVVGKAGFEPATSASRTLRANQAALLPGALKVTRRRRHGYGLGKVGRVEIGAPAKEGLGRPPQADGVA